MQLRQVDLRSVGHSNQKLSQKIDFWNFHSTSTSTETSDGLPYETYGSINLKKFTRPSFTHPKPCSERRSRNQNFFGGGQPNTQQQFPQALREAKRDGGRGGGGGGAPLKDGFHCWGL